MARARHGRLALLGALALLPWAARAQAPRGEVLDIKPEILDIVGVDLPVDAALRNLGATVSDRAVVIALDADVLFDFDKAELKPAALDRLAQVAGVLKKMGKSPVAVEGHTDAKGKDDYNQKLSERRAAAVRDWLVKPGGVAPGRLSAKGFGPTRPVAPNARPDGADDPEGRQKNRRVEIRVRKA